MLGERGDGSRPWREAASRGLAVEWTILTGSKERFLSNYNQIGFICSAVIFSVMKGVLSQLAGNLNSSYVPGPVTYLHSMGH